MFAAFKSFSKSFEFVEGVTSGGSTVVKRMTVGPEIKRSNPARHQWPVM